MIILRSSVSTLYYFEKTYDSVRKEVLYNILNEFGILMKLVRLIKMCPAETYNNIFLTCFLLGMA
jgi:hypothetical protein